jgi:hypothetical protein
MVETRSMKKAREYEVNIDFDAASLAWRANKKTMKNGTFEYICLSENKVSGKPCGKPAIKKSNQYQDMMDSINNIHSCGKHRK